MPLPGGSHSARARCDERRSRRLGDGEGSFPGDRRPGGGSPLPSRRVPVPRPPQHPRPDSAAGSMLLSVQLLGDASGTVTASGVALTCSALQGDASTTARLCWALVPASTPPRMIRLTASPGGPDARFSGWGGELRRRPAPATSPCRARPASPRSSRRWRVPASSRRASSTRRHSAPAATERPTTLPRSSRPPTRRRRPATRSSSPASSGWRRAPSPSTRRSSSWGRELRPPARRLALAARSPARLLVAHLLPERRLALLQVPNARVYPQWWGAKGDGIADDVPPSRPPSTRPPGRPSTPSSGTRAWARTLSLPRGVYRYRVLPPRRAGGRGPHRGAWRAHDRAAGRHGRLLRPAHRRRRERRGAQRVPHRLHRLRAGAGKFRDGVVVDGSTWPTLQNLSVSYASRYAFRIRGTLHARLSTSAPATPGPALDRGRPPRASRPPPSTSSSSPPPPPPGRA